MTMRRIWLMTLMIIAIVSVGVYGIIVASLTNQYFETYMAESYANHVSQILNYSERALAKTKSTPAQMAVELETHLIDPIIRIKLYDMAGNELVNVDDQAYAASTMMHGRPMNEMMRGNEQSEVDQYEVMDGSTVIGKLNIFRRTSAEESFVARLFKVNLLKNSLLALLISGVIAAFTGFFISKKLSQDLTDTADMAQAVQFNEMPPLIKSNVREIDIIRESLNDLNVRLRLKQKSRKVLVDQVIHETKTPITVLRTHLEGMEDGFVPNDAIELRLLQAQVADVSKTLNKLSGVLDAERLEQVVEMERFEVSALVTQIVKGMKGQFQKKKIELICDTSKKFQIDSDRHILSKIIYNLLTNAYKYTPEGGRVEITYDVRETKFHISVEDNGIGIRETELDAVFDAYFRGENQVAAEGEGLGLYLVKESCRQLHGTVSVKSTEGEGSHFAVEIEIIR